ncbi:MAG TPA: hypothetical protein VGL88_09200 [Pseudonocardiaceae bacterium]
MRYALGDHVAKPQGAYVDHLAATVDVLGAAPSVLRLVIALASSRTLTDREVWNRLLALAESCVR